MAYKPSGRMCPTSNGPACCRAIATSQNTQKTRPTPQPAAGPAHFVQVLGIPLPIITGSEHTSTDYHKPTTTSSGHIPTNYSRHIRYKYGVLGICVSRTTAKPPFRDTHMPRTPRGGIPMVVICPESALPYPIKRERTYIPRPNLVVRLLNNGSVKPSLT